MTSADFDQWMRERQTRVERVLEAALPAITVPPTRLHEAMHYAVLGGGKRVRPLLVYASAELTGCERHLADAIAAAIELIHAYSLVHDDLPAMDNDELRRGKPTVWKAYGQATAMLAGDALQSAAFELLAGSLARSINAYTATVMAGLAKAAGSAGMCGGQQIDIESAGKALDVEQLQHMHRLKTGALLRASVILPAQAAGTPELAVRALDAYAASIGLAFQVADDVLDATADTSTLGKTAGKDAAQHKATYVTLLGLAAAQEKAENLRRLAHQALSSLTGDTTRLSELADMIVQRTH
jgi:farnesyl diphosphate synthase